MYGVSTVHVRNLVKEFIKAKTPEQVHTQSELFERRYQQHLQIRVDTVENLYRLTAALQRFCSQNQLEYFWDTAPKKYFSCIEDN